MQLLPRWNSFYTPGVAIMNMTFKNKIYNIVHMHYDREIKRERERDRETERDRERQRERER